MTDIKRSVASVAAAATARVEDLIAAREDDYRRKVKEKQDEACNNFRAFFDATMRKYCALTAAPVREVHDLLEATSYSYFDDKVYWGEGEPPESCSITPGAYALLPGKLWVAVRHDHEGSIIGYDVGRPITAPWEQWVAVYLHRNVRQGLSDFPLFYRVSAAPGTYDPPPLLQLLADLDVLTANTEREDGLIEPPMWTERTSFYGDQKDQ